MNPFRKSPPIVPERIELAVGVRPEDGTIIDVGPYRHRVNWTDGGPSSITYCNNCGGSMVREGRLQERFLPGSPREKRPMVSQCATCHAFQGYLKHERQNKHEAKE